MTVKIGTLVAKDCGFGIVSFGGGNIEVGEASFKNVGTAIYDMPTPGAPTMEPTEQPKQPILKRVGKLMCDVSVNALGAAVGAKLSGAL